MQKKGKSNVYFWSSRYRTGGNVLYTVVRCGRPTVVMSLYYEYDRRRYYPTSLE